MGFAARIFKDDARTGAWHASRAIIHARLQYLPEDVRIRRFASGAGLGNNAQGEPPATPAYSRAHQENKRISCVTNIR